MWCWCRSGELDLDGAASRMCTMMSSVEGSNVDSCLQKMGVSQPAALPLATNRLRTCSRAILQRAAGWELLDLLGASWVSATHLRALSSAMWGLLL